MDADEVPVMVEKTTCGTVATVESTVVVKLLGMTEPDNEPVDSVHGTVSVVTNAMVVMGTGADVIVTEAPVAVAAMVTVEAAVIIAGLVLTYGAQIPWK